MTDNPNGVSVTIPNLGIPEMEVGVWYVRPGDRVYFGDRLVEIIVAGATVDVTSPVTGTLAERTAMTRDRVVPGAIIGSVVPDSE